MEQKKRRTLNPQAVFPPAPPLGTPDVPIAASNDAASASASDPNRAFREVVAAATEVAATEATVVHPIATEGGAPGLEAPPAALPRSRSRSPTDREPSP